MVRLFYCFVRRRHGGLAATLARPHTSNSCGEFRVSVSLEFRNMADAMTSFDAVVASMDDDDYSDEAEPAA